VVNLKDLMEHISLAGQEADLSSMRLYRDRYGLQD
jgi:hypothetical protein